MPTKLLIPISLLCILLLTAGQCSQTPLPQEANLAPSVNAGQNQTVEVGSTVTIEGTASDPDGDDLTYAWSVLDAPIVDGVSAKTLVELSNKSSLASSFVAEHEGTYSLLLSVSDGAAEASDELTVIAEAPEQAPNTAPTIETIESQAGFQGEVSFVDFSISDEQPDSLSFELSSSHPEKLASVSVDAENKRLKLVPTRSAEGVIKLTLKVTDSEGKSATASFNFEVNRAFDTALPKFIGADTVNDDQFGSAVALSDKYALVGAVGHKANGHSSGAAYIFERDKADWKEKVKLTASDAAEGDEFGSAVAIHGTTALISSAQQSREHGSGTVYIFEKVGQDWREVSLFTSGAVDASGLPSDDAYGHAVAVYGSYALIGAYMDNERGTSAGAAYLLERQDGTWQVLRKLVAGDAAAFDQFGFTVALNDKYAFIGAFGHDDAATGAGAVYVYERDGSTWTEETKLTASDAKEYDFFGSAIALSESYAVIGSSSDEKGKDAGAAYMFKASDDGWQEVSKLTASDGAAGDAFGFSVATNGTYTVIGAYADDDAGDASGSAYLFRRQGTKWIQVDKLRADDGAEENWFGYDVAINQTNILVAANDAFRQEATGKVYAYLK